MVVLWLNLTIAYVFSFFSRYFAKPARAVQMMRPNLLMAGLAAAVLIAVSGLRDNIGDTFFYMHSYALTHFTLPTIDYTGDFGFNMLQLLLQRLSSNPQVMIFVCALITNALIVAVLYNYSKLFELSVYVYITAGMFLTSMNGIRQYLAAAIVFTGTKYLLNGDWKKYFAIVLLAATFHKSALIFVPIYFLVRHKAWTKTTFVLIALSVLIVIGFNQFSNVLFTTIADTQYGHYQNFSEGGANINRVFIAAIPVVIAFFGRHKLRTLSPGIDVIVNMSLLNGIFMIISTQDWIFARFSIYFGLYYLILIAWIVKLFREKDQKLVYYAILGCYLIFYYYEEIIALGIQYGSHIIHL